MHLFSSFFTHTESLVLLYSPLKCTPSILEYLFFSFLVEWWSTWNQNLFAYVKNIWSYNTDSHQFFYLWNVTARRNVFLRKKIFFWVNINVLLIQIAKHSNIHIKWVMEYEVLLYVGVILMELTLVGCIELEFFNFGEYNRVSVLS